MHRLVLFRRRYRDLMTTMVAQASRLLSVFILIFIIYYAFAIVGMEFFAYRVYEGCCNTSWYGVQAYYSGGNNTGTYYLANFNNILRSYGE